MEWVRFQFAAYEVSCRVRIGSVEILRASTARFTPGQDLDSRVTLTRMISAIQPEPGYEIRVPRLAALIGARKLGRVSSVRRLSHPRFAESEVWASLRDDVRRGVGVTIIEKASVALVVPSANRQS